MLAAAQEVAEQVGREILDSRLEPGAWATALSECGGKRQEALAVYTRIRVRQLTRLNRMQRAKNRSFECRRIAKCMGDQETREAIAKTIQDMLVNKHRGKSQNFLKPRISLMWLTILFIGTSGTVAAMGRLWSHLLPESIAHPMSLIALLCGVAAVWMALVLRYFLPKPWVMIGWNTGLVVICNIMCLSSLFLGTKLIKRAIATDSVVLPFHQNAGSAAGKTAAKSGDKETRYLVSTRDGAKAAVVAD